MKTYYLDKRLNIIVEYPSNNCTRDQYITLYEEDNSTFIDTFQIVDTKSTISFAYTIDQLSNYEKILAYYLEQYDVNVENIFLIRRCYPKDVLASLLKIYGIKAEYK